MGGNVDGGSVELFDDKELWALIFHPQTGEIPKLHKTMNKLCNKLTETTLVVEQHSVKMEKYNGLHEQVEEIKENCKQVQRSKELSAASIVLEKEVEEEVGKRVNRFIYTWSIGVGTVALILTLLTFFVIRFFT